MDTEPLWPGGPSPGKTALNPRGAGAPASLPSTAERDPETLLPASSPSPVPTHAVGRGV